MSTDRGPGATYRGGQDILISIKSTLDCFIKLFDVDASGNVQQLLGPVRVVRNQVIQSRARVVAGGVFGAERLIAVASSSADAIVPEDVAVLRFFTAP